MRKVPKRISNVNTSYVLMFTTSLPFRVREAHHLVTRPLLQKIIAYKKLSSNLFFQPSWTQKSQWACQPLYWMALAKQVGVTERIPGRNAPIMEKGMFQMHFIGISLGYNKSFPFIVSVVKEESCLLMWAFIAVMQKIPCWFSMTA